MTKAKLEGYVGAVVTVTLFDGDTYTGKLRKTGTEDLKNKNITLFCTKDRYFVETDYHISPCFRCSHIIEIENGRKN